MHLEDLTAGETLEALICAMRDLLEVVDMTVEDDKQLNAAWDKCQLMLNHYRAKSAAIVSPSDEESEEMDAMLQTVARLNAIATHMVQREADRVGAELVVLRDAKKKLRLQISRSAESGGSVDLAG